MAARQTSRPIREAPLWRPQALFEHNVNDRHQLEGFNHGAGVAVAFETLPQRPVHIAIAGSQTKTLSVWNTFTRHGFRTTPKVSGDLITLRFVTGGYMSRDGASGTNLVVNAGQALFASFEEMRHEMGSPGFLAITATISRGTIADAWCKLNGLDAVGFLEFEPVVDVIPLGMQALRNTISLLKEQIPHAVDDEGMMIPMLEELLTYQFLSAWPLRGLDNTHKARLPEKRPLKLAIDYLNGNLSRKIEISEVACVAGISVRLLQMAFKSELGCSPFQYLIERRLDHVHSELQTPEVTSVRQAASRWGFTHMGDFSRRYRERFGRTPRQTMQGAGIIS